MISKTLTVISYLTLAALALANAIQYGSEYFRVGVLQDWLDGETQLNQNLLAK